MLAEIQELEIIYPTGELINQLLVQFARRNKDYDLALKHAGQLVENFPEKQVGFQLQGDILFEKKLFEQALANYEKALHLSEGPSKYDIYKKISASFSKTGKAEDAYNAYKKAIVVFATGTSAAEYYELGRLALKAGKKKDGIMYLRFARQMLSDDDKEMKARINGLLLKTALQGQFK
jgi:tetratricopeptide (TPR) repeat protein